MNENNTSVEPSEQKPKQETAAARWRKLIEQQQQSGLGVSAYCRERGISAASMFAWKRRLQPAGALSVGQTFKPVRVVSKALRPSAEQSDGAIELPAASFIELRVCGGRCREQRPQHHVIVRRGFDRQLLIELVQALESLA